MMRITCNMSIITQVVFLVVFFFYAIVQFRETNTKGTKRLDSGHSLHFLVSKREMLAREKMYSQFDNVFYIV